MFSEINIELMAAQCFLFFVGGFDTSSSVLSFILLELAQNSEVQNKAREEILSVLASNDGKLTYDMLKQFTYLNMILAGRHRILNTFQLKFIISQKIFYCF